AVYMALGAAIAIAIAQLGFYLIVSLITTDYIGSITVFWVLSYNLYLAFITMIPNIILTSSILNKQKVVLYFYSIGLVLNIICDILVIKLGYGIVGVAWVTICTQSLVTFALYYSVKGYIFRGTIEFVNFQIIIAVPFLACVPFYFLHYYLDLATSNLWFFTGASLGAQVIVWSLVISVFYRDYCSVNNIKIVAREISTVMRDRFPK
ncbi:polysaccharide biosynthesis C-terminal domain-containing protein, partial [Chloroflexota bacterium]